MNLTEIQRQIVAHRESSLLVSASAGSGKTEVLAQRCLSLIADPKRPCGVDELLVVTFTRAAAAELRSRIARRLYEQAAGERDAAMRSHLRRQVALIGGADIVTFDSWCGRIVRENFAAAGVDPGFAVLSAEQAGLVRERVMDALFDSIYRRGNELAPAVIDWLTRHPKADDGFLRRMVRSLHDYCERLASPISWLAAQLARHSATPGDVIAASRRIVAASLRDECALQAGQIEALIAAAESEPVAERLRDYQNALAGWAERLAAHESLATASAEVAAFSLVTAFGRGKAPASLKGIQETWVARLQKRAGGKELPALVDEAPAASELAATLIRLTVDYRERLAAAKRRAGAMEFADVQRAALDLLGGPERSAANDVSAAAPVPREATATARALQKRYGHVLIDEFQDTSAVQVELVRLVSRDGQPSEVGNRFMVGDLKQSIYGFRSAEPRLFAAQAADFESGARAGVVRRLTDNFRAHPALVAGVNSLFAGVLRPELGGSDYGATERLVARRSPVGNISLDGSPRLEVHIVEQAGRWARDENGGGQPDAAGASGDDRASGDFALERIEREACVAAECIRAMLNAGVRIPRQRGEEARLEPLKLADIVILLRAARGNAALTARILRDAGIDCVAAGRESLLDSVEASDMRAILALLTNRRQDLPLAAYLRGPFVGLSPAELVEVAHFRPRPAFCDAVLALARSSETGETAQCVRAALAQLDAWSAAARQLDLPALLRRIRRAAAYESFALGLRGGRYRVEMLRAMDELAAEFAKGGQGGVAEFVAFLDEMSHRSLKPDASLAPAEDAVRVMTIHAVKGLEIPVVFLLGAGAKFNLRGGKSALQCDEQRGLGVRFFDYPARRERINAEQHAIRFDTERRELEEEMRLLYVAATRAREKLFLVGHAERGEWEERRSGCAGGSPPTLVSLLESTSLLDWATWGVAANRSYERDVSGCPSVAVRLHDAAEIVAPRRTDLPNRADVAPAADDGEWILAGERLVRTEIDDRLSQLPASVSISALKARQAHGDDESHAAGVRFDATLEWPEFASRASSPDATALGIACHTFLQFADMGRITAADEIAEQAREMVAAKQLTAAQVALLPHGDLAWLGATAEGRILAQACREGRLKRETPFVYALPLSAPHGGARGRAGAGVADDSAKHREGHAAVGPYTARGPDATLPAVGSGEFSVLRGVIDCVVETPGGLTLFDYKTDFIRDDGQLAERASGYERQIQAYAAAARRIFDRPVLRAALLFVRARRVIEVPLAEVTLEGLQTGS